MLAQAADWPWPVHKKLGPVPVNKNLGPGPVNTNWGPGPANTGWGQDRGPEPGSGDKQRPGGQEIQIPAKIHLYLFLIRIK